MILLLTTLTVTAGQCPTSSFEKIAPIVESPLDEASGIVVTEKLLWFHNDSGDSANIYAVDPKGSYVGSTEIKGAALRDWEEMTTFRKESQNYFLIGDIGDNKEKQSFTEFYVVKEQPYTENLSLEYYFTAEYDVGPKDAEAMFVDPQTNELIVITKGREGTSYWLKAPLPAKDKHIRMTSFHSQKLSDGPLKTNQEGTVLISAADISPDGSWIVVRNYLSATIWHRAPGESLAEAIGREGCRLPLPLQPQGETIAFSPDGKHLWTLSEGKEPILYQITLEYPK